MRIALFLSGLSSLFVLGSQPSFSAEPSARIPLAADQSSPWVAGASPQARRQATELFDEGTKLASMGHVGPATEVYRSALKQWDHPTIHLELAKVLARQDKSKEALVEAWASLRYASAVSRTHVDEANRLASSLLDTKLVHLVVTSSEPGLSIMFGSEVVLKGPGTWQGVVTSGTHQVSAQRTGDNVLPLLSRSYGAGTRAELTVSGARPAVKVVERRTAGTDLSGLQRQLVGFSVASSPSPAPGVSKTPGREPLPPRIASICADAKGDTAIVCAEYATLHDKVQREQEATRKRLDQQTHGGLVDVLR